MNNYNVIIDLPAEQDIEGILFYISSCLQEPDTAGKIYLSIYEKILSLDVMPSRQPVVYTNPKTSADIRKVTVGNYMIFYIVYEEQKEVHVIRVIYNRREWENLI